jgi:hypothetical protein
MKFFRIKTNAFCNISFSREIYRQILLTVHLVEEL